MQIYTNWYFDIEEQYSGGTHEFSVGPFSYAQGSRMTLLQLATDINSAFMGSFAARISSFNNNPSGTPLYQIEINPQFDWKPLAFGGGLYAGMGALPAVSNHEAFPIKTTFLQTRDPNNLVHPVLGNWQGFRIEFKTGDHGWEVTAPPQDTPYGTAIVQNETNTRSLVLPHSSQVVAINDNPPVPPNVQFVPYNGVNNRLLILLNSNTGEYPAVPIPIKAGDLEALYSQFVTQNGATQTFEQFTELVMASSPESALVYKNDDPIRHYEVFRTTTKPTSYADFDTNENPHELVTGQITLDKASSAASLVDSIQPNIKYYYCFRATDVHQNFSNPTHVFEAELVDNDGQVYLILNPIYFENNLSQNESKVGRRFVYIEPSLRNMQYTPPGPLTQNAQLLEMATVDTLPSDNLLSQAESAGDVWGKTFKIRVTSKKTGKKVDINVTFQNSGVVDP